MQRYADIFTAALISPYGVEVTCKNATQLRAELSSARARFVEAGNLPGAEGIVLRASPRNPNGAVWVFVKPRLQQPPENPDAQTTP